MISSNNICSGNYCYLRSRLISNFSTFQAKTSSRLVHVQQRIVLASGIKNSCLVHVCFFTHNILFISILTPSSFGPQSVTRSSFLPLFGISMLPFGTYPRCFFKPTITTIQRATSSPPPASEQLLPSSTMTSSKASPSPSPGPETLASSHTPAPKALPDHEKFSVEERDFLRSHLLAYRAHCAELDRLGSGP